MASYQCFKAGQSPAFRNSRYKLFFINLEGFGEVIRILYMKCVT